MQSNVIQPETVHPFERSKCGKIGDCFIIFMIYVGVAVIAILTEPNKQYIPMLDGEPGPMFQYPDVAETHSSGGFILCGFGIIELLFLFNLVIFQFVDPNFSFKTWLKHLFLTNRMFFFCFGIADISTLAIKHFVGSPRPYFAAALKEYENDEIDIFEMNNARQSFASGHSSLPMALFFLLTIMMYSAFKYSQNMYYNQAQSIGVKDMMRCNNPHSYYLAGLWHLLREIPLLSIFIICIPTVAAVYIALTRIVDYKHFAVDVVAGMLIGITSAIITYLVHWNELYFSFNKSNRLELDQNKKYKVNDRLNV